MGYFAWDWTYDDYKRVVAKALANGEERVGVDTEHCSYQSDYDLERWAKEDGYLYESHGDCGFVTF